MGAFWSKFVAGVEWLWVKVKAFVTFVVDFVDWLKSRRKAE
jgi:hypothetical protein